MHIYDRLSHTDVRRRHEWCGRLEARTRGCGNPLISTVHKEAPAQDRRSGHNPLPPPKKKKIKFSEIVKWQASKT